MNGSLVRLRSRSSKAEFSANNVQPRRTELKVRPRGSCRRTGCSPRRKSRQDSKHGRGYCSKGITRVRNARGKTGPSRPPAVSSSEKKTDKRLVHSSAAEPLLEVLTNPLQTGEKRSQADRSPSPDGNLLGLHAVRENVTLYSSHRLATGGVGFT